MRCADFRVFLTPGAGVTPAAHRAGDSSFMQYQRARGVIDPCAHVWYIKMLNADDGREDAA